MLNLNSLKKISQQMLSLSVIAMLLFLASCLPQSGSTSLSEGSSTTNTTAGSGSGSNGPYPDPTFAFSGIFIQEGSTQTSSAFPLPLNFNDSFLIRGSNLSQYLRTIPNTTKLCLVGKYTYSANSNRYLVLSAKTRAYTDLAKKTTEHYLQVEPSNQSANQNDCLPLAATLVTSISDVAAFSLSQLCTNCNSSVTSEGLQLLFLSGQPVPILNLSALTLTISGSTTTSGNACVESTTCQARGFDCCLEGQCVRDGAERPDAFLNANYTQAKSDVASNPSRFVLYPEIYFVCTNRPEGDGKEDNNEPIDPGHEASIRLMELNQIYQCLNQVDGEFSYCTVKFTNASQKITAGSPFSPADKGYLEDINFSTLNSNFLIPEKSYNILKIFYAGQTLYEQGKIPLASADGMFLNNGNDTLLTAQSVKITKALPSNAQDDNLYLTFKVDGSCSRLSSTLAKCSKTYVHNSDDTNSVYYHNNTNTYYLPSYADTGADANLIVKIGGVIVPEDPGVTWNKFDGATKGIQFTQTLFKNQTIEINYYVKSNVATLLKIRSDQQSIVNSMCLCSSTGNCNLKPIYDAQNKLSNFECSHPSAIANEPPANQTAYVSNKNVPHRYFDINGLLYDGDYSKALDQEGTPFSYKNSDLLKPSNVAPVPTPSTPLSGPMLEEYTYTGFNEIYGSFSKTVVSSAKPAKTVSVKKDKVYDLYANSGIFSTCLTCGSDYYSALQKIFPQSFTARGGGYSPDNYTAKREGNTGLYRGDDLLYGRACFVPATMLPWTHATSTSVKQQRLNRLAAQHFLFANGYNRDWYGFDYGSLIGSFDGVTWFSIGNARRIKATSNRLYLAINAYFGDLSIDSNFNVTISETTSYSTAIPDHDLESDGAECQKSHVCSNDNDCIRQLGYDYTCQSVAGLSTKWPVSDSNGVEIIGETTKTILSLVGGSNGQPKRCVYRGRGTPCHPNLYSLSSTFNGSASAGLLACSPNNMCQPLVGANSNRFNDRVSRFANSPTAQNTANAASTPSDLIGLGARILGRPFDYYGNKIIKTTSQTSLTLNGVTAICIPGKNINSSVKMFDLNSLAPSNRTDTSDEILGIGTTINSTQSLKYLNACPVTNASGVNMHYLDETLGSTNVTIPAVTQNLSVNLLDITPITAQGIFSSSNNNQVTSIGYQRNACLRAAGASCFSDMDCAPSSVIADKVRAASVSGLLNSAEEAFWEEDLVCGNPDFKFVNTGVLSSTFDPKKNACCREFGKDFTVYTETNSSTHRWCLDTTPGGVNSVPLIAGLNAPINSTSRYSRIHSVYDKFTCNLNDTTKSFALSMDANGNFQNAFKQIQSQYKTLDALNQKTCCTQHWVRNFDSTNGGGHRWGAGKLQTIDKSMFRGYNWGKKTTGSKNPVDYHCEPDGYTYPDCEIRDFSTGEKELYLRFFGALELVGIPQVAIMSEDFVSMKNTNHNTHDSYSPGTVPPTVPHDGTPKYIIPDLTDHPPGGVTPPTSAGPEDLRDSGNNRLFSGTNPNLPTGLKKVFSDSSFSCCIPSGQRVPDNTVPEQCCTGYLGNTGASTTLRCCLPNYTNVTAYLSRYVSSEGRGYPDSAYDPNTGYIKDPAIVEVIEASKQLCCSGKAVRGVAIRKLPIPMTGGVWVNQADAWTTRFTYRNDAVDNNGQFGPIGQLFDAGIRWNNHVYCVDANDPEIPAEPN